VLDHRLRQRLGVSRNGAGEKADEVQREIHGVPTHDRVRYLDSLKSGGRKQPSNRKAARTAAGSADVLNRHSPKPRSAIPIVCRYAD
jgi:hypothetical protein